MIVQPKPIKVFSRDEPCSKVDLTNCFFRGGLYVKRATVETQGEIGVNAPKYLLSKGYMRTFTDKWVDYQELTELGRLWLEKGLKSHLQRYPQDRAKLTAVPPGIGLGASVSPAAAVKRISRTRR